MSEQLTSEGIAPVLAKVWRDPKPSEVDPPAIDIALGEVDPDFVLFDEPVEGFWVFYDAQTGALTGVSLEEVPDISSHQAACARYLGSTLFSQVERIYSDAPDSEEVFAITVDIPEAERAAVLEARREHVLQLTSRSSEADE